LTICISYQLIAAILQAIPIFSPEKQQKQHKQMNKKKHLTIKTKKYNTNKNKNNTSEATGQQVENNFTVSSFFFFFVYS